ncbi:hypothetical protein [Actinomadura rugatobispora]|uniref:PH domain-containing protein n=1 Tax=Actinomadura rugatobispora TaxID=1994 RepID=A0ABW1A1X6_9ACTN|nr:hypothetical protein GCM10010200_007680 [Actinomadura rugatobispora]
MRRTFRSPLFCVVAVVILEMLVFMAAGGIATLPLMETAQAIAVLGSMALGQIPVVRSAVQRVTVTSEGLTQHSMFMTRFTPWSEISEITLAEEVSPLLVTYLPVAKLHYRRFRWRTQVRLVAVCSYDRPPRGRAVRITEELERLRREYA